jgi:class 3 adenylate cyclase
MESKSFTFNVMESDARIKEILDSAEAFEEVDTIPSRTSLTYSNGYYVNCTAVFIDIRGSSKLTETHNRPVIGKLYRSYISECIAIMNADQNCKEVFISGDCVSGIFDSTYKSQIVSAFETAGQLSTLIELLNWRLSNKGYKPIICGIGISYGRALMIKAGANGSGVNDVVWIGDVVNEAAHLCHEGNRDLRRSVQVSKSVFINLTDEYRGFCTSIGGIINPPSYETDIYNVSMRKYFEEEKKKAETLSTWIASIFSNTTYPTGVNNLGMLASGLMIPPKK